MGLKAEIDSRRATIHTDGYPMSIGELINLYRDREIDIHPEFQRFYRWTREQRSKFVESLLLGIPIPSIFVSQREDGTWDVIDGLQRLSTIFELVGILRDENDNVKPHLTLSATKYLPSLEGKHWDGSETAGDCLDEEQQLIIKRSKLDVKIVLRESDGSSKFELFQRINTGGSYLSDQELRNCILIMMNPDFHSWLEGLSRISDFANCISLSDRAIDEQYDVELVVRFLVFRSLESSRLRGIGDIGDFLTDEATRLATSADFNRNREEEAFRFTFSKIVEHFPENDAFCRYNPETNRFSGGFLISAFEVLAMGLGANYEAYNDGSAVPDLREVAKRIWQNGRFTGGIGSGVTASRRIPVTVPLGREQFQP